MAKNTCRDCNRIIVMVRSGGDLVATDPELIRVVPARDRAPSAGAMLNGTRDGPGLEYGTQTFARRLHAERCSDYQEQNRKARIAAEQRQYNERQQGRAARSARKNRGL